MSGLDKVKEELMKVIEKEVQDYTDEIYRSGYADGREYEQMLRIPKHDADRIEQIKDLIRESDKNHAYTLSYPAYVFISRLKKIVGWQLEDYEEPQKQEIPKYCEDCFFSDGTLEERKIHCYRCSYKSEWKERKTEEIKVGDEVKVYDDCIGIVTRHAPQARTCYVMYRDGSCGEEELTDCKKTGNHSMSLDKWLEQMRKESHEV